MIKRILSFLDSAIPQLNDGANENLQGPVLSSAQLVAKFIAKQDAHWPQARPVNLAIASVVAPTRRVRDWMAHP
jgi:hypothetical protein